MHTAKNATDLLQVVNFTGLLQLVDKLQQECQFHQVVPSVLKSGLLQFVICRLVTTCYIETTCSKPGHTLQTEFSQVLPFQSARKHRCHGHLIKLTFHSRHFMFEHLVVDRRRLFDVHS